MPWPSSRIDRLTGAASHAFNAFNTPTISPIPQSRSGSLCLVVDTRKLTGPSTLNGLRDRYLPLAHELLELQPDVIAAVKTPGAALLQRGTRAIPIVFTR